MMSKSVRSGDAKIIVGKYFQIIKVPRKPRKMVVCTINGRHKKFKKLLSESLGLAPIMPKKFS